MEYLPEGQRVDCDRKSIKVGKCTLRVLKENSMS